MNKPPKKIHAFTIKKDGIVNRIITELEIASVFDPTNPPAIEPQFYKTTALWDTGATGSVIAAQTVASMGLIPTGIRQVNHAGGTSKVNSYLVNFLFPEGVLFPSLQVYECDNVIGAGAIIGMDIICNGDFTITNFNNQTWMSFRLPSMKSVDYVSEFNKLKFAGIRPNAPCPCGSGKKFKKCCRINI